MGLVVCLTKDPSLSSIHSGEVFILHKILRFLSRLYIVEWILVRVDRDALDFLLFRKGFKECTVQKPPISAFCVVSFGQWCLSSEFPRHAY